jgi:ElaB/YqjD/DUF883 family membrane-anchored ribosome-binding protein
MAGTGEGGSGHPRMQAGLPSGPSSQATEQKGLGETARELASSMSEAAGQMREKAQDLATGFLGRAEDAWRSTQGNAADVAHRVEDFWGDVTQFIRRYPVASLFVAFGAGCVLSHLSHSANTSWGTDDVARRMSRSSQY